MMQEIEECIRNGELRQYAANRLKGDKVIAFPKANAVPNRMDHFDALFIKIIITNIEVRLVYVDIGASVIVIYLNCFRKMRLDPSNLKFCSSLQLFTQGEI